MSSLPLRPLQVWLSSAAKTINRPIRGVFRIEVMPALMVEQTLQFLHQHSNSTAGVVQSMLPFIEGSRYWHDNDSALFYEASFDCAETLFSYDVRTIYDLVRELELHTDVNFTIVKIVFLADVGTGPNLPLLVAEREAISRGIGFEIEERGMVANSLSNGELNWTDRAKTAQQYYSTGIGLLALEDQISGLIDAAYMQFYLATEAILEAYVDGKAIEKGTRMYGSRFNENIQAAVKRVFLVRNNYFGHAGKVRRSGQLSNDAMFAIAKQTLVARWCARALIELEVAADIVHREMRLYPGHGQSFAFYGDANQLDAEFALPN